MLDSTASHIEPRFRNAFGLQLRILSLCVTRLRDTTGDKQDALSSAAEPDQHGEHQEPNRKERALLFLRQGEKGATRGSVLGSDRVLRTFLGAFARSMRRPRIAIATAYSEA